MSEIKSAQRFNTGKHKWRYFCPKAFIPMLDVLEYGALKYTVFEIPDDLRDELGASIITGAELMKLGANAVEEAITAKWPIQRNGADQWKDGMPITEIAESLQRHLYAFLDGEDNDPESGLPHIGHMMCNIMFLSYNILFNNHYDDRKNIKKKDISTDNS